jgi:PAS domain S-box-containing protein
MGTFALDQSGSLADLGRRSGTDSTEHTWLRQVLGSLSDGVIATDARGCVRFLSHTAEALTGWTQAEALGRSIEEIFPVYTLQGRPVEQCQLRKALAHAEAIAKQRFRLRTRRGVEVPIEDSSSPILSSGQVIGAVTMFQDISERLAAERRQARRRRGLRAQVSTTAAELVRTRVSLQALSRRAQDEERRRVARELHDDLGQQAALLDLEISRLQGQLPLDPDTANEALGRLRSRGQQIAEGLRSVSHRLHPLALEDLGLPTALHLLVEEYRRCGADIRLVEQGALPPLPPEATTALYRIAQEALRNARQHAPRSPVRLTLYVSTDPAPGATYLSIEDAGPGFALEQMRERGGLGLLSMQERAHSIGGSLEIDAAPGEGTRISVLVPRKGRGPADSGSESPR